MAITESTTALYLEVSQLVDARQGKARQNVIDLFEKAEAFRLQAKGAKAEFFALTNRAIAEGDRDLTDAELARLPVLKAEHHRMDDLAWDFLGLADKANQKLIAETTALTKSVTHERIVEISAICVVGGADCVTLEHYLKSGMSVAQVRSDVIKNRYRAGDRMRVANLQSATYPGMLPT